MKLSYKHAEHDVDGDQCREDEQRFIAADGGVGCRCSLKAPDHAGRHVEARPVPASTASTAWPSEDPCATLKETVTTGNCPWWEIVSGDGCISKRVKAESGTGVGMVLVEAEPPAEDLPRGLAAGCG